MGEGGKLFKGGALRLFQTFLYAILFLCAAIILGIYSWFLALLTHRDQKIAHWKRAVEGIAGAATLYLIFAVLLTCCFGGVSFLAFTAIVLDVCFIGGMIAIAYMTRAGVHSCQNGGTNPLNSASLTECRLNRAAFVLSIIAAFLFLCTALLQLALIRSHKKEKRYGPGPDNNYTSGSGKKRSGGLFGRKNKHNNDTTNNVDRDAELGTYGAGAAVGTGAAGHHHTGHLGGHHADTRPSGETGYTGSTVAGTGMGHDKVDGGHLPHGTHGGYHTQPQGTGANPYGYDNTNTMGNTRGTATNY